MNHTWEALLWDSLTPPTEVTSAFGDIVLVIWTHGSIGEGVTVSASGWTPGVPPSPGANPHLLWRQDLGHGMGFAPVITNPDSISVRWAVVRIRDVDRLVGTVKLARAAPPGIWDFIPAGVEDTQMFLAVIQLAQVAGGALARAAVGENLLTPPDTSGWVLSTAGVVRTLTPHVDFSLDRSLSDFSFGTSGGAFPRSQSLVFVATWGPPLPSAARVRSSVSEDAGSLFQATQAVAVELGISETFEYGADVGSELRPFREALTPELVALRYYAVPTRNQEMLATVEGETNLGRLAHTIAPRIFTRGTGIPGNDGGVVTAQQAIQHVVNRWQSEHTWLVFEPIPDLRLMVPEAVAAPRQHYLDNPSAGIVTTSNVVIEQEGNERRTMREVLDEWTSIFPGTTLRQTSSGTIELVPRVGPDAPDGAALALAWRDFARFSDGEDDPRGIYNRARVTSQGWEWSEDTPLTPPLFIFSAASNGLQRSVLESEEVMPSAREETWLNSITPFTVMNDGTPVTIDLLITAFGSWNPAAASNFSVEGTAPHQFTIARGQRRDVAITHNTRGANVTSRWRFERLAAPGPDVLYVTPLNVEAGGWNIFGSTYVAYLLEFDVTGMAWTKSNEQVTSEFGQSGDHIPADGGGNALDQSRALYGERVATINSTVFQLDNVQARQAAESYVLFNINPRTVRDVQQSEWNRYPVKFEHIGRFVELPNGEVAVVENRAYSDSFAPRASAMMSTFTATVSHSVIDTSTQYLFNSDGSYWENDDGTISEVL